MPPVGHERDDPDYADLVFARGYLLTRSPMRPPRPSWGQGQVGRMHLYWDPRQTMTQKTHGDTSVTLVGHAVHVGSGSNDLELIVGRLLNARRRSRTEFLIELEELAGRYVVVDVAADGAFLQSDAVALRNAYYHAEGEVVASHQNLVAESVPGIERSVFALRTWRAKNRSFSTPGSETHWRGVKFLNANLELNLDTFQSRRVEMRPPTERTVGAAVDELLMLTRAQIPALLDHGKPVVSLTAGQDSRTTLAMLRPEKSRFHYFTYALHYASRAQHVRLDLSDSRRLADEMGLPNHTVLHLHGPLQNERLNAVLARNSVRSSNRNIAERYLTDLPQAPIHIRSSFNEVGVAGYRARYGERPVTAELLAEILTYGTGYTQDTLDATSEYMESTSLHKVPGYDPLDLYYWEVRMGSWLGTITAESDIAFDTHILISSRRIVRLLLSVNVEARMSGQVYDRLIERAWPELYSVPVNGRHKALYDQPGQR